MDPNATMELLRRALDAQEWHEVAEHIYSLETWIRRGGFLPAGPALATVLEMAHATSCRWTIQLSIPTMMCGAITSWHSYQECAECGARRPTPVSVAP